MKKIIILLAVILTSALTALSITRKENKSLEVKASIEKSTDLNKNPTAAATDLATAD